MSRSRRCAAVVVAAGEGRRLGQDKALVDLGGRSAVQRVVDTCRLAGWDDVVVVRRRGATGLPDGLDARIVEIEPGEMIDSVRAGLGALREPAATLVFPVDYPLVPHDLVAELRVAATGGAAVALPICRDRPGHPIALAGAALDDVRTASTLRDVVRRDPTRVATVGTTSGWALRDLDDPADLRAARGWLEHRAIPTAELMARHRSRRAYTDEAVSEQQLRWLVDSARYASTSSFIQAYAVVAVRDPGQRARIAVLCGDQPHVRTAPVFLAICADLHKLARACERHGGQLNADTAELFVQATVDAALVGQNLQLGAESEGLGACMIGAARDRPVELAQLLGLPRSCYVVFGMTLGWPADDPVPRGRMPLDLVLHDECYATEGLDALLDRADDAMRAWARAVNARLDEDARGVDETRGWTDRMARLWRVGRPSKGGRGRLLERLRALGFGVRDVPDDVNG